MQRMLKVGYCSRNYLKFLFVVSNYCDRLLLRLGTNYWRNRILKIASTVKGKVNFAVSNKDEFTSELTEFGFDYVAGDKPVVAGRNDKNQKFVMKDEFRYSPQVL